MRTVLDVTVCTHSRGGVGRWVRGLSSGLQEISSSHVSIDLPETHPSLVSTVENSVSVASPFWMKMPLLRRYLLKAGILESSRADRIEKVTGPADIIHLSGVQPVGRGKRKVVTFFDDTPWSDPDSHTHETLFYAGKLEQLIRNGAAVLAISRWSAGKACALFGIPEERTGCAGGAADDFFQPGQPDSQVMRDCGIIPGEYFLHVGSFVPRKNIPFLIQCFEKSSVKGKKLVLAGAEKWGLQKITSNGDVISLEDVSDHQLLSLYRGAEAVLVPSSEEGLGLPVLEALACGTPVVSSDGGALPETVSGNGKIIPALSVESWVEAIETGATDQMRKLAEKAERHTWTGVAARAMAFYRKILS